MLLVIGTIIVILLTIIYVNGRFNESYWKKRGVKFHKENKVMGPFWDFLTGNRSLFQLFHDIYKKYPNEPAVGIGSFFTPALYVRDPKNVHHIMQSDFNSFHHRGFEINKDDKLADNVLFMNGARWKLMRQNMTPLFTSTKLKNMFYIIDKSALDFVEYLKQNPEKLSRDTFDTLTTFCCAAIGGAVFGITTKSTFDSPFLKITREAFYPHLWGNIRFSIQNALPFLFKILNLKLFANFEEFFIGAIKNVLRQREKENVKRHDFADTCIHIQKQGYMKDNDTGVELEPTDELLAAQAFFFFTAGVEPVSTAILGVLMELGQHEDILKRVQEEIDKIYNKHENKLTYDAVVEMEYLDKVMNEALRMHPPIGFLTRQCVRDTVLPVGNIKIEKGTKIYTPIYEFHNDPKYYENPEVFDPERVLNEHGSESTYLPFGKGNRICIGMRYAKLQVKAALVHVLRRYNVKTIMRKGNIRYRKEQVQLRIIDVDIEFIPKKML